MGYDFNKIEDLKLFEAEEKLDRKLQAVQNDQETNVDLAYDSMNCIRTFIKYAMGKIYVAETGIKYDDAVEQNFLNEAKSFCNKNKMFKFLYRFHEDVQGITHVSLKEYLYRRLFNKYIPNLIKMKQLFKTRYGIDLFKDISIYPFDLDQQFAIYYSRIRDVVDKYPVEEEVSKYTGVYYVEKKRFIYIGEPIYELTLVQAYDKKDKFNRFIVFSKIDVMTNYCITAKLEDTVIKFLDTNVDVHIKVLTSYALKIRNIELQNMEKLLCLPVVKDHNNINEYKSLMTYLKNNRINLIDIIDMNDADFATCKNLICEKARVTPIFNMLSYVRRISISKNKGCNIIRYLLYKLRNTILNDQFPTEEKPGVISNTNITMSSLSFDESPYYMDPKGHITSVNDVFNCIDVRGHEQELLARKVNELSDSTSSLYIPINDLQYCRDIDKDIELFNSRLYFKECSLERLDDNYLYIRGLENITLSIFKTLYEHVDIKDANYHNRALNWITMNPNKIKGSDKMSIIPNMFTHTGVSIIYGAAGTGKSTLIDFTLDILNKKNVIGLAYTNSALDNLRSKLHQPGMKFKTVSSFNEYTRNAEYFDVVVIDECSTLSNRDMAILLSKIKFRYIILAGDTYQIPSIKFGNWFSCAMQLLPDKCMHTLTEEFRSSDNKLKIIWKHVRELKPGLTEKLSIYKMTNFLSQDIFVPKDPNDEIILCLNYDGIYGINNINLYLQSNNNNVPIEWDGGIYKVGDPILFNDLKRFDDLLYNNLKGKILEIEKGDTEITFTLEVNKSFKDLYPFNYYTGLEHVENLPNNKSKIKITIYSKPENYFDKQASEKLYMMPFQIAYAVSIHKSQGLEYNSVKVIINDETEEMITHNIFYTAITRAKKYLNIYWSTTAERKIIDNFKIADHNKDAQLLKLRLDASK